MEIGKLEDARKLISPLENRIKYVEAQNIVESIGHNLLGMATSFIRGASIVGGTCAIASNFNENYTLTGLFIGGLTDMTLNTLREIGLRAMRRDNKKEYEDHLTKYKRALKINYGKYAA